MTLSFIHLADKEPHPALWTNTFRTALAPLGRLTLVPDAGALSPAARAALVREHDVVINGWGGAALPAELAAAPGRVRYICHLTGGMRTHIPLALVESPIPVTNWGDAPAFEIAEGALTLLLACLKNLRSHIDEKRDGQWSTNFTLTGPAGRGGTLRNLRVGLYGVGVIGRRFATMLHMLGAKVHAFDPFAPELPEGVRRVATLTELFAQADAVSLHAGVNPSTIGSVNADLLRLLPDGGIVINTARGQIIDQEALFAELASGRLRAGLDVLDHPETKDALPAGHPARQWSNLILSAHAIGTNHWPYRMSDPACPLQAFHENALDNLARFSRGESLRFRITPEQYQRMT
jgi:phosphoglycerate dehydrogenase-like enzyme